MTGRMPKHSRTNWPLCAKTQSATWLRAQHWNTAQLCVVMDPKDAVKLGRRCPSGDYLDIAADDAMLIGRAVGAA